MDYGHAPHTPRDTDLQIIHCWECGWVSPEELAKMVLKTRGIPWYCDRCGKKVAGFVRFDPSERAAAYQAIGKTPPETLSA
jgi:uncharacterized Zn finger protein